MFLFALLKAAAVASSAAMIRPARGSDTASLPFVRHGHRAEIVARLIEQPALDWKHAVFVVAIQAEPVPRLRRHELARAYTGFVDERVVAVFDRPSRAVRCVALGVACAIRAGIGLRLRRDDDGEG